MKKILIGFGAILVIILPGGFIFLAIIYGVRKLINGKRSNTQEISNNTEVFNNQ